MKNTFGTSVAVTLFGESHGPGVGAVIDGLAPGLPVDEAFIASQLTLRRPAGRTGTARQEADDFRILSGVFEGRTTGTPLTLLIPNEDTRSGDYQRGPARPGHADYTAYIKYHGYENYRGGGHFSGRVTAGLVAAAAVVIPALKAKGILIGTHVTRCAGIDDAPFGEDLAADLEKLNNLPFAVLDEIGGIDLIIPEFRVALDRLLTSDLPILGVLKSREDSEQMRKMLGPGTRFTAFAERLYGQLSKDMNTELLQITENTEEEAGERVKAWIQEYAVLPGFH